MDVLADFLSVPVVAGDPERSNGERKFRTCFVQETMLQLLLEEGTSADDYPPF
jgi:hypothetical protein